MSVPVISRLTCTAAGVLEQLNGLAAPPHALRLDARRANVSGAIFDTVARAACALRPGSGRRL